jgi:hypothetical protein
MIPIFPFVLDFSIKVRGQCGENKCYISFFALDHKWEIPIVYNEKNPGNRLAIIIAQNLACWCKGTKNSAQSLSLLTGTHVFMLTPIDEEATPLSGMLRRLFIAEDCTCTLSP